MDRKNIYLDFDLRFQEIKELNPSFDIAKIAVAYHGLNRNRSFISKEVFENAVPSLFNIPVVGRYIPEKDDFGGHDIIVVEKDGGQSIEVATVPFGVVPESASVSWQNITEEDGTEREYLIVDCVIWKRSYGYKRLVSESEWSQSMEVTVNDYSIDDNDIMVIKDMTFCALCILGTDVEPCFESANIQFSATPDDEEFKKNFSAMLSELKEFASQSLKNAFEKSTEGGEGSLNDKVKLFDGEGTDPETTGEATEGSEETGGTETTGGSEETGGNETTGSSEETGGSGETSGSEESGEETGGSGNEPSGTDTTGTDDTTGDTTGNDDGGADSGESGVNPVANPGTTPDLTGSGAGDSTNTEDVANTDDVPPKKKKTVNSSLDTENFSTTYNELRDMICSAVDALDSENSVHYLCDFDDEYVYIEKYIYSESGRSKKYVRTKFSKGENGIILFEAEEMFIRWLTADEVSKLEAEREELNALRDFKAERLDELHKEEVDTYVSDNFSDVCATEEFEALGNEIYSIELDQLTEKLYAIRGRHASVNFSKAVNKTNESTKIPVDSKKSKSNDEGRYGSLFATYAKN